MFLFLLEFFFTIIFFRLVKLIFKAKFYEARAGHFKFQLIVKILINLAASVDIAVYSKHIAVAEIKWKKRKP